MTNVTSGGAGDRPAAAVEHFADWSEVYASHYVKTGATVDLPEFELPPNWERWRKRQRRHQNQQITVTWTKKRRKRAKLALSRRWRGI